MGSLAVVLAIALAAVLAIALAAGARVPGVREPFLARRMHTAAGEPTRSPAALAFDGALLAEVRRHAHPALAAPQSCVCAGPRPSEAQLERYLTAVLGGTSYLPAVAARVPVEVRCLSVRGCRSVAGAALVSVEFTAMRAGDVNGVLYEAHVLSEPLALAWFRRRGDLPAADAIACAGR